MPEGLPRPASRPPRPVAAERRTVGPPAPLSMAVEDLPAEPLAAAPPLTASAMLAPPGRPQPDAVPAALPVTAPLQGSNGHAVAPPGLPMPVTTTAQLRRFIKSRAWVPMHELRRRFGINGVEDDVTPVQVEVGTIYVGLPAREGGLLGELLRAGDIGYELSLDPRTPIVVGVYPMRPVPRH